MESENYACRIYWEDTDAGGIVYYANYLRFLERARTEWLRRRGIVQSALARDPGVIFAVVSIQLEYRKPARLDDLLYIGCRPAQDGATLIFHQDIRSGSAAGELLVEGAARVACLDAATMRPRRLPPAILEVLKP